MDYREMTMLGIRGMEIGGEKAFEIRQWGYGVSLYPPYRLVLALGGKFLLVGEGSTVILTRKELEELVGKLEQNC